MSDINTILINAGISTGIFILYKIINHYRIHSSCNQNNQLVIEIVDIEKPADLQSNLQSSNLQSNKPIEEKAVVK